MNQGIVVITIVLLMVGITFLTSGLFLVKKEIGFFQNATNGLAIVSAYNSEDYSSHIGIRVDIVGNEQKTSVLCHSKGIKKWSDFPIGTTVKVKYLEKSFLGVKFLDVRLAEKGFEPSDNTKLGKVFTILGAVLLIFCAAFVIISLLGGL